jgi:acyl-CoA reductase-like NAD-dependent aldehyde dehydrogenase
MTAMAPFAPHGRHFVAGRRVASGTCFQSKAAHGLAHNFPVGRTVLGDEACKAAKDAFWSYRYLPRKVRANFLKAVAGEIEARAEAITEVAAQETGLPAASLVRTTGEDWLGDHALADEVFGPPGLIVTIESLEEMRALALSLAGQLTLTLHMNESDTGAARILLSILERRAGRDLAKGFPTGVAVADAGVHGGPPSASTSFGHTIRRWLRPVCHQKLPASVPQEDLH